MSRPTSLAGSDAGLPLLGKMCRVSILSIVDSLYRRPSGA